MLSRFSTKGRDSEESSAAMSKSSAVKTVMELMKYIEEDIKISKQLMQNNNNNTKSTEDLVWLIKDENTQLKVFYLLYLPM